MKCIKCGANTSPGITTDVTDLGSCLIIIRNVPCDKCNECTEIFYTGIVVKHLEKIVEMAKTSLTEVAIVNYSDKVSA